MSRPGPRGPAGHGKLRDLHKELDKGIVSKTGYVYYTVWQAAEDWLATGLDGLSQTVRKNQNVLEPILTVIGAQAPRADRGRPREGAIEDGRRLFQRGGDHGTSRAEAHHPARRSQRPGQPQRRDPGRYPQGPGRPAIEVVDPMPRAVRRRRDRVQSSSRSAAIR
jgi:hypothetical protein